MKKFIAALLALALCLPIFCGLPLTARAAGLDEYLRGDGETSLTFTAGGRRGWRDDVFAAGKRGASSGNAGADGTTSAVSTTAAFAENQGVSFLWRVESQEKWDYLAFFVDDREVTRISGKFGSEKRVFPVPEGTHTLSWRYIKDEAYGLYADRGWLDDVSVVSVPVDFGNVDDALNSRSSKFHFENDGGEPWTSYKQSDRLTVARSGNAGKCALRSVVSLETELSAGEVLNFNWGVDSEESHDELVFEVGGVRTAAISGKKEIHPTRYVAKEGGSYVFRWIYEKDVRVDKGADCGYLYGVRVGKTVPVTGIRLSETSSLMLGTTIRLLPGLVPGNTTENGVTWKSERPGIATVSEDGTVTGVSLGTANITATNEAGASAVCAVTVREFNAGVTYYVSSAGNDGNRGASARDPLKTLQAAVRKAEAAKTTAKIFVIDTVDVGEPVFIYGQTVNIAAETATAKITRKRGYHGPIIHAGLDSGVFLGRTDNMRTLLTIGGGKAEAPAVIADGGDVSLLRGCEISGNTASVSGAGVYVKGGTFSVSGGKIISNKTARYGGGIYADGGAVNIYGGAVESNEAGVYGGGVYLGKTVSHNIDEKVINDNRAKKYPQICYGEPEPPAPPTVTGVEDGAVYDLFERLDGVSAFWMSEAEVSATLNGESYERGAPITATGVYTLVLDDGFNKITISFEIIQTKFTDENGIFIYEKTKGGVKLVGCVPKNADGVSNFPVFSAEKGSVLVAVPETLDGLFVLKIARGAFDGADMKLGAVSVPATVTAVEAGALANCTDLERITFRGKETAISADVFEETPAGLSVYGFWPSTAYDFALSKGTRFVDMEPYEPPVVTGAEEGGVYYLTDFPDGLKINWTAKKTEFSTLNGESYEQGAPITAAGGYVFTVGDGRSEVSVSFTVYEKRLAFDDVDGDEAVTVSDALLAMRFAVRLAEPTAPEKEAADADNDGVITIADAVVILRAAIGL